MNFKYFFHFQLVPIRTLFSREELGVIQIESVRQKIRHKFGSPEDIEASKKNFVDRFPNLLLNEKRDFLKEYIMLIDKSPDDLQALKSILVQYQDAYNHSVHSVKDFVFGTQIMRIFYLFNLPDDAVKVISNSLNFSMNFHYKKVKLPHESHII